MKTEIYRPEDLRLGPFSICPKNSTGPGEGGIEPPFFDMLDLQLTHVKIYFGCLGVVHEWIRCEEGTGFRSLGPGFLATSTKASEFLFHL